MAERIGRIGRGGERSEIADDEPGEPVSRGGVARGRGLTTLLAVSVSAVVIYVAWWVLWDQSHPASSAAWRLRRGDRAARLDAIRDLGSIGAHDPDVALPALVVGLSDPDPGNRAIAADCLVAVTQGFGATGPQPEQVREALSALVAALDDPVAEVRPRVAQAIGTIVWTWHGSMRALDLDMLEGTMIRIVDDPDVELRSAAVQGLAALALRASEPPPPRVIAALEDPSEQVRESAARGLAPFHRALIGMLPELVVAAEKARPECRPAYFRVLRWFQPPEYPREVVGELIRALVAALETRDREIRCQVVAMLGEFGHDAREAIPALLRILDDPVPPDEPEPESTRGPAMVHDPAVAAAQALRRLTAELGMSRPSSSPEVVAGLIRLLDGPTPGRRLAAVQALSASFEADEAIVGALVDAAGDPDESVRVAALQTLQGRGARLGPRAIAALAAALEDPSPRARAASAYALNGFGPGVEPVVPALIRHAADDRGAEVRELCAEALAEIGPGDVSPAVVPIYLEALGRPGAPSWLRRALIEGLGRLGPPARAAVPAIVRELAMSAPAASARRAGAESEAEIEADRPRVELRREAAHTLGLLAPGTPAAADTIAALIAALDDPADDVNQAAGEALEAFGQAARGAAPMLLRDLERARASGDMLRAGRMAEAIGRIDPTAPGAAEVIAFLASVLRSNDHPARLYAERVLGFFGPAAAAAVPDLVALARRPAIQTSPELASIATALGLVAPGTPGAGPAVAALLDGLRAEPRSPITETVIDAVSRFGPGAEPALPRLRELAGSRDARVAEAARQAVGRVRPKAEG